MTNWENKLNFNKDQLLDIEASFDAIVQCMQDLQDKIDTLDKTKTNEIEELDRRTEILKTGLLNNSEESNSIIDCLAEVTIKLNTMDKLAESVIAKLTEHKYETLSTELKEITNRYTQDKDEIYELLYEIADTQENILKPKDTELSNQYNDLAFQTKLLVNKITELQKIYKELLYSLNIRKSVEAEITDAFYSLNEKLNDSNSKQTQLELETKANNSIYTHQIRNLAKNIAKIRQASEFPKSYEIDSLGKIYLVPTESVRELQVIPIPYKKKEYPSATRKSILSIVGGLILTAFGMYGVNNGTLGFSTIASLAGVWMLIFILSSFKVYKEVLIKYWLVIITDKEKKKRKYIIDNWDIVNQLKKLNHSDPTKYIQEKLNNLKESK